MAHAHAHDARLLRHYEGLIFTTARLNAPYIDDDVDDIEQVLRIKVHHALLRYEPGRRPRMSEAEARDKYVFTCVLNQVKDLRKRKPRRVDFIEELAPAEMPDSDSMRFQSRDRFEMRYLSANCHDEEYAGVCEERVELPNTLSLLEREVIARLYAGFRQSDAARELGIEGRQIENIMRSIRTKMADWRPSSPAPRAVLAEPPLARAA